MYLCSSYIVLVQPLFGRHLYCVCPQPLFGRHDIDKLEVANLLQSTFQDKMRVGIGCASACFDIY